MFVYDALGSLAPSDVQKCAKGVTYTDGPKYLPGLDASPQGTPATHINWPVIVGAAVVGGVIWFLW